MKYIPVVFAAIGVVFAIIYTKWGFAMLQALRDIRDRLNNQQGR